MAIQFPPITGSTSHTPFPTLSQIERQQSRLIGQLASGNRLTSAAVDAGGVALAEQLTTQVNGLAQAQNNIADAGNLLNTAEGGLASQQAVLQQERQLSVEAGNGALNGNDLQIIQGQIEQLNAGLNQTGQQTEFNGIALLNGAAPGTQLTFQTGANAGQTTGALIAPSNTTQLGTNAIDVTTQAGQQAAVSALDQAIQSTSANRGTIGATENNLAFQGNNAAAAQENQLAARSALADTNFAQASTALQSTLLLQTSSLFALQQQANTFALQSQLLAV